MSVQRIGYLSILVKGTGDSRYTDLSPLESHEGQPQTIDLNNRGGGAIDAGMSMRPAFLQPILFVWNRPLVRMNQADELF